MNRKPPNNKVSVVLGAQWGDEGKGKLVDLLATSMDVTCRCAGGNNAGHTVVVDGVKYAFHLLPSGITSKDNMALMGPGMVIHLPGLFEEIVHNESLGLTWWREKLLISDRAHLVMDYHQELDAGNEAQKAKRGKAIGTTKKGIGPAYASKASRTGLRVGDLVYNFPGFCEKFKLGAEAAMQKLPELKIDFDAEIDRYRDFAEKIRPLVVDSVSWLTKRTRSAEKVNILVEGANATMLDIDHGTYPYVTSSSCSIGGVCTGLGLPPCAVGDVFGVAKAYCTRVGGGPFPSELENDIGSKLQEIGHEYGVTTGRRRRCGWIDLPQLRYADRKGYKRDLHPIAMAITKLDVMDTFETVCACVGYLDKEGNEIDYMPASIKKLGEVTAKIQEFPGWMTDTTKCSQWDELPENAKNFINFIEQELAVPIRWVGVGPARDSIITRSSQVTLNNTGKEL